MENKELLDFIEESSGNLVDNPWLYEVTFLKIYVKFEKFLANIFEMYSLGISNSLGYCPNRKLRFDNEKQLRAILNGGESKPYIEYIKKIESLSKYFFDDDPFKIIFEYSNYTTRINQMTYIRNYIAHESDTSKKKYIDSCLCGKPFIEPGVFLQSKNKRYSKSNFSIFVDTIIEISNLILQPKID